MLQFEAFFMAFCLFLAKSHLFVYLRQKRQAKMPDLYVSRGERNVHPFGLFVVWYGAVPWIGAVLCPHDRINICGNTLCHFVTLSRFGGSLLAAASDSFSVNLSPDAVGDGWQGGLTLDWKMFTLFLILKTLLLRLAPRKSDKVTKWHKVFLYIPILRA